MVAWNASTGQMPSSGGFRSAANNLTRTNVAPSVNEKPAQVWTDVFRRVEVPNIINFLEKMYNLSNIQSKMDRSPIEEALLFVCQKTIDTRMTPEEINEACGPVLRQRY
jgi:hypothetical protein